MTVDAANAPIEEDDLTDERRIDVPMPPKGTTNFDYEMKVAIWRVRITDLFYGNQKEIRQYRKEEDDRHQEMIAAITGRGKAYVAFWTWMRDSTVACVGGVIDIAKAAVSNENGQLKWMALLVLGLAVISTGGALSGLGFHISTSETEAPGVESAPAPREDGG